MRACPRIALTVALLAGSAIARAEFIDLPVKWSQPIGYTTEGQQLIYGIDHLSNHALGAVLANDWQCNDPEPVVAVRWWGSYIGDHTPRVNGNINGFDLSIHLSTGNHPFSLPSPTPLVLWQNVVAEQDFVGWDAAGDAVYRYDAYLPSAFPQVPGTEYFLDIDSPLGVNWGWHDAALPYPVLDWSATAPTHLGTLATFNPLTELAFEIMVPEPTTLGLWGLGLAALFILRRRNG